MLVGDDGFDLGQRDLVTRAYRAHVLDALTKPPARRPCLLRPPPTLRQPIPVYPQQRTSSLRVSAVDIKPGLLEPSRFSRAFPLLADIAQTLGRSLGHATPGFAHRAWMGFKGLNRSNKGHLSWTT